MMIKNINLFEVLKNKEDLIIELQKWQGAFTRKAFEGNSGVYSR